MATSIELYSFYCPSFYDVCINEKLSYLILTPLFY